MKKLSSKKSNEKNRSRSRSRSRSREKPIEEVKPNIEQVKWIANLKYQRGNSNKFWKIRHEKPTKTIVVFGRIGGENRYSIKEHPNRVKAA